jgi:hypothetical protein
MGGNMGPWGTAIVAVAAVAAGFFAVMGFRGLMQALDFFTSARWRFRH